MKLLVPFGVLYSRIADLRNRLYDRGTLRSHSLGARTISIGNLTTGGTGKTPLVALAAKILAENGENVCVLTRGYGRKNIKDRVLVSDGESVLTDVATGGDEPVELGRNLIGKAVVVADADRVAAALWARRKFGITAFVLDDGFQHRRAKRDLDIVCIDAKNPCGNGRVLPAGSLREPFKGLHRADLIVATRTNLVRSTDDLMRRLRKRNERAPIFSAQMRIKTVTALQDFLAATPSENADNQRGNGSFAFCGLGNPKNFRRQLESENFAIAGFRSFGDHHRYSRVDVDLLENDAKAAGATALLTTAKDAVKLAGLEFELPVFVAVSEMIVENETAFGKLIVGEAR